jgi:hypothetical protein
MMLNIRESIVDTNVLIEALMINSFPILNDPDKLRKWKIQIFKTIQTIKSIIQNSLII